jgi:hypothetical protein
MSKAYQEEKNRQKSDQVRLGIARKCQEVLSGLGDWLIYSGEQLKKRYQPI